jgi:iron complex outermembrane recepter protein
MIQLKPMSRYLAIAFGGSVMLAGSAFAQEAQKQERIEVTGSSIKRIDAETALPVTVIKKEDIQKSGASNVAELVDRLTSNNGGGRSLGESFGETSASGQSGASLRGLGRDRTLVLLNGRRLAVYPFQGGGVDLNAIPLAAVERIEILRDGASAVYGSDAIGGVINFITRRDFTGIEITGGFESPQKKGGKVSNVSAGFGFGDLGKDRFNVLGVFNYEKYTKIQAADRDFASTGIRPDLGIVSSSGNTFPANGTAIGVRQVRDADTRAPLFRTPAGDITTTAAGNTPILTNLYIPGAAGFPNCAPPASFGGAANCRYDFTSKIDIYPATERTGLFLRGNLQLNADNLLFAEVSTSKNVINYATAETPTVTTGKPGYTYPGGGRYYPTAAVDAAVNAFRAANPDLVVVSPYRGPLAINWRIVDGGQRKNEITNEMTRFLVGAEGVVAGFDYRVGFLSVESKATDLLFDGWFSDTRLRQILATGNVNPFGANDAAGLALLESAKIKEPARISKTSSNVFDAKISREIGQLAGGAMAFAAGFETRTEKYDDGYTAVSASGDIVGGSGNASAVRAQRSVNGFFGELSLPFAKGWEAQVAIRHDAYSSAKPGLGTSPSTPSLSSTNPKVSIRWQPNKQFLLRGSYGTGFRAPTLDNFFSPASFTNTGGQFNDPYYNAAVGCAALPDTDYCDTQLTAQNNSNPNLKPEKSKQFTLGVLFEPTRDLSFGIDYFDIKITNGISALSGDDILNDWYRNQTGPTTSSSVYANRLIRDPATGFLSFLRGSLENIGQARVAGFDLKASYRFKTSAGTFTPTWDATYLTKSTTTNVVSQQTVDSLGEYVRGGPTTRVRQLAAMDWTSGNWGATLQYFWQSGYTDYSGSRRVGSYEIFGLQGQYKGIKGLTLTAGIRNLLDRKPPTTDTEDYFQVGFDPTYSDVKGRTFYLRGTYKF